MFGRPFVKRCALCYWAVVCMPDSLWRWCTLVKPTQTQTVGCIRMPLVMEVGLGLGHIVFDGDPAPLKGAQQTLHTHTFRPMSIVAKRSPASATAELLVYVLVLKSSIEGCLTVPYTGKTIINWQLKLWPVITLVFDNTFFQFAVINLGLRWRFEVLEFAPC